MQSPSGSGSLPSNTVANPRGDLKAITTRSGVAYDGPTILPTPSPKPKEVKRKTEATKDKVQNTSLESTTHVQPPVVQDLIPEPDVAPKSNPKPSIPYPSRLNDQKLREKANNQMLKFLQIFQRLHFDIIFADAHLHMPKFSSTFKKLDECLALADLGASINLMPLSVWKHLSPSELTSTRMALELADRLVAHLKGVAEDVFVKTFLRTERALIDVHGEELMLRVDDEAIKFKVGHTSRYSRNYYDEMVHQVNVIDVACEEYAQEVLGFLDSSTSGNLTPSDPIIASSSPSIDQGVGSTSGIRACALRNFDLEVMELKNSQNNALAKLPMLKLGEYEMWEIRIKQYFQIQDYALSEVIENGNSWVPIPVTIPESGPSTALKMIVPSTAEEKTCKKNDVKVKSLLLMALPNEHQLTFD
ncbi:hypothetical protein Tco_1161173 [Tanacetum coccineum]